MNKLSIISGTRAEYGLLEPIIRHFHNSDYDLSIIVTGMHLSSEFGLTYNEIIEDGYMISDEVDIHIGLDTKKAVAKSIGSGVVGFADSFDKSMPDLLVVLGDRYETYAACIAAMAMGIPIAHIHGGETTEGVIDEAIRHAITKMSYLHFTSTETYRKRVIQLGESPERVFCTGAIGVENIMRNQLYSKEKLEKEIGFKFSDKTMLVTYHPVTLQQEGSFGFEDVLEAISVLSDYKILFTKANADAGGNKINSMIDEFVVKNSERAKAFHSLGRIRYLSTLQYVSVVVGNSSSGIIEVPSFKIPTIDIGDRQKGRVRAASVINVQCNTNDIVDAIYRIEDKGFREQLVQGNNPYYKNDTSGIICSLIEDFLNNPPESLQKKFYDILF